MKNDITTAASSAEQPAESTLKRRGFFAAAAAVVAAIVAKPKNVEATAGTGPDGNLVLGSNFLNTPNSAGNLTVLIPGDPFAYGAVFDVNASQGGGTRTNINAIYGAGKGIGSGVVGTTTSGSGAPHIQEFNSCGVAGYGSGTTFGVVGASDSTAGVIGSTSGTSSIGVWGQTLGNSGYGVWGNAPTAGGTGVLGVGTPYGGVFAGGVYITGALTVIGAKSAAVPDAEGTLRRVYCVESPESWFEDFGHGKVVDGIARIKFEEGFASIVHADDYHVFISPRGESNGLFIASQTPEGFEVHEQGCGTSSLDFSYRIVARRKDIVAPRLETVTRPDLSATEILKSIAKLPVVVAQDDTRKDAAGR